MVIAIVYIAGISSYYLNGLLNKNIEESTEVKELVMSFSETQDIQDDTIDFNEAQDFTKSISKTAIWLKAFYKYPIPGKAISQSDNISPEQLYSFFLFSRPPPIAPV